MNDMGLYHEFINGIGSSQYKEPNYSLIDELVMKYQSGSEEAAEELIRQLAPYMLKFFKIIRLGIIDLSDKDSRKFISLFIDDHKIRSKLKAAYQPAEARKEAYQAAQTIQILCTDIPSEDIIHELIVILLTLARRFTKKRSKVNFCGYLCNAYRFELARRIKAMTTDPLSYRADLNLSYNDQEYLNEENLVEDNIQVYVNEPLVVIEEELGNSWIRGITCSERFAKLTPLQRIILKMHYLDGEGDTAIADRLGIHRNTVREQRMKAEEILRDSEDDADAKET